MGGGESGGSVARACAEGALPGLAGCSGKTSAINAASSTAGGADQVGAVCPHAQPAGAIAVDPQSVA